MTKLFLFSKGGKEVLSITAQELSTNFVVALQTLSNKFKTVSNELLEYDELEAFEECDGTYFVVRDLGPAELLFSLAVPEVLLGYYSLIVQEIAFSILSCRFVDILTKSPEADLYDSLEKHVPELNLLLSTLTDSPAGFVMHYRKLQNWVDASQIFEFEEIIVLIFDECGVIQVYIREDIELGKLGKDFNATFARINAIYRVCRERLPYICIPEIASTASMQIAYFNIADDAVLAVISGVQGAMPAPTINWKFAPALEIDEPPKRIHGLAVVHIPSHRAAAVGKLNNMRVELAVHAAEQGSAFELERDGLWDTAWLNGEYCICIESDRSELLWGEKVQEEIIAAAYRYFAFRAWMIKQAE